jgi:hypothetical protein
MATLKNLKPGQVLYSLSRRRMGNTTLKTTDVRSVRIVEVHAEHVVASYSGHDPRVFWNNEIRKWRTSKPTMKRTFVEASRLATKEEIATAKEAGTLHEASCEFYIRESRW